MLRTADGDTFDEKRLRNKNNERTNSEDRKYGVCAKCSHSDIEIKSKCRRTHSRTYSVAGYVADDAYQSKHSCFPREIFNAQWISQSERKIQSGKRLEIIIIKNLIYCDDRTKVKREEVLYEKAARQKYRKKSKLKDFEA